jgi:hypothetical protein
VKIREQYQKEITKPKLSLSQIPIIINEPQKVYGM